MDATDQYGNLASDFVDEVDLIGTFVYDSTAPEITLLAPVNTSLDPLDAGTEDDDKNTVLAGYQILPIFEITGEATPEEVEVCLTVNSVLAGCHKPVAGSNRQYSPKLMSGTPVPT